MCSPRVTGLSASTGETEKSRHQVTISSDPLRSTPMTARTVS
jgi:hypothetical protein